MLCKNCGNTENRDGYKCMDCGQVFCDRCYSTFVKRKIPFAQMGEAAKECPRCGSKRKYVYIDNRLHKQIDGDDERLYI